MTDDLDQRLGPLVRLRNATAELLASAHDDLRRGPSSPGDRQSVRALTRQLASFDRQLKAARQSLSRAPRRPLPPFHAPHL